MRTQSELSRGDNAAIPASIVWAYRAANIALNALNTVWCYKMLCGAMKALRKLRNSEKKAE